MLTLDDILARCTEEGECLLWSQGTTGQGYPCGAFNNLKSVNVRRWVAAQCGLEVDGLRVLTRCRHKLCLATAHLFVLSAGDANRWMARHGELSTPAVCAARAITARKRPGTKLTMEKARLMRARRDEGAVLSVLAGEFGVSPDTAWKVVSNQSWRETARGASVFNL